ncbi:hypothetical protein BDV29DRAFT_106512 [Aspergillus leporis]|uniref:Uncharacterized protein n=1 Tax=Aspergillus leporis TaxID=41062 RepID=A0A5N5X486_9EURO|nr:hypothetical protein BDV29DRAFT_106512 [Aspergillus leporis]
MYVIDPKGKMEMPPWILFNVRQCVSFSAFPLAVNGLDRRLPRCSTPLNYVFSPGIPIFHDQIPVRLEIVLIPVCHFSFLFSRVYLGGRLPRCILTTPRPYAAHDLINPNLVYPALFRTWIYLILFSSA